MKIEKNVKILKTVEIAEIVRDREIFVKLINLMFLNNSSILLLLLKRKINFDHKKKSFVDVEDLSK